MDGALVHADDVLFLHITVAAYMVDRNSVCIFILQYAHKKFYVVLKFTCQCSVLWISKTIKIAQHVAVIIRGVGEEKIPVGVSTFYYYRFESIKKSHFSKCSAVRAVRHLDSLESSCKCQLFYL